MSRIGRTTLFRICLEVSLACCPPRLSAGMLQLHHPALVSQMTVLLDTDGWVNDSQLCSIVLSIEGQQKWVAFVVSQMISPGAA